MKKLILNYNKIKHYIDSELLKSDILEYEGKEYRTEEIKVILKGLKEKKTKEDYAIVELNNKAYIIRFVSVTEVHIKETEINLIKRLR